MEHIEIGIPNEKKLIVGAVIISKLLNKVRNMGNDDIILGMQLGAYLANYEYYQRCLKSLEVPGQKLSPHDKKLMKSMALLEDKVDEFLGE